MELKFLNKESRMQVWARSNRTFMELKFGLRTLTRVRIGF